jgi:hypothetical protein
VLGHGSPSPSLGLDAVGCVVRTFVSVVALDLLPLGVGQRSLIEAALQFSVDRFSA